MKKIGVFLLAALTMSQAAQALNIQNHRYYFHGGRADTLVESRPKPKDTLTLGLGMNFALEPYELSSSAGAVPPRSVVDYAISFDMGSSYSFSDKFMLGANVPVHVTNNVENLGTFSKETVLSLGDIQFAALYNIIDGDDNPNGLGLSVAPFLSFPTGVGSNYIGDANVTAGLLLAGDAQLGAHYLGLNLGLRFREEEQFLNLRVAQELLYGVAYHHPILEEQELDGFAEITGSTVLNEFFQQENSSPVEAKIGVSKVFVAADMPIRVKLVNGMGIGNGYGNPDYRLVLALSYDHEMPRTKTKIVEKTVTIERVQRVEQRLKELTIYYPTDGAKVDPFYDQKIAGIATVMKENPDMGPLYIVGHTDDVGKDVYNVKLSEKRARQAFESIMSHGLSPRQIVWFGLGETYPVVPNTNDSNRALNRRTVFTFQRPSQLSERAGAARPLGGKPENTDSYTEVLKQREAAGFVDESAKVQTQPVKEEVRVKEETVIREEEPDHSESAPTPVEKRVTQPVKKRGTYNETSLDEPTQDEDDFDEPFVE